MKYPAIAAAGLAALSVLAACVVPPGLRGQTEEHHVLVQSWDGNTEKIPDGWQYIEIDGPVCANGTPVGMGLNAGDDSSDLVIYLNGGGACWDTQSCNLFQTAANLDITYNADRMAEELGPLVGAGLLDRTSDVHPFPDAHMAFIPYCTGDLHSGQQITKYDSFAGEQALHHRGADNIKHYLQFLSQRYGDARRVWLVGTSAGGYGITWNFEHFQAAFPDAEIHVFADASPWLRLDDEMWAQWRRTWGLTLPTGCVMCEIAPDHLLRFLIESNPETRFAMSVHKRDSTLAAFLRLRPAELERDIAWFLQERYYGDNTSAFVAEGSDHEAILELNNGLTDQDGQSLAEFFRRWALGE